MREEPIDPRKIRGKFVVEKPSTDIEADPIDDPMKKSWKKGLPVEKAEIEVPEKNKRPMDALAMLAAVILMMVASFISLVFNMKNAHLGIKKFHLMKLITVADCAMIVYSGFRLLATLYTIGQM